MENSLRRYIRDEAGNRIGLILGKKQENGELSIGWSICHPNDRFNKNEALFIAENRADAILEKRGSCVIPRGYAEKYNIDILLHDMANRMGRYFKTDNGVVVPDIARDYAPEKPKAETREDNDIQLLKQDISRLQRQYANLRKMYENFVFAGFETHN